MPRCATFGGITTIIPSINHHKIILTGYYNKIMSLPTNIWIAKLTRTEKEVVYNERWYKLPHEY